LTLRIEFDNLRKLLVQFLRGRTACIPPKRIRINCSSQILRSMESGARSKPYATL
jgi:hypothetical protein